jgi:hypothetical protein
LNSEASFVTAEVEEVQDEIIKIKYFVDDSNNDNTTWLNKDSETLALQYVM